MIVLKLRGARQRIRAKEGRCEGRKPFGDRPGEQAVIERAKALQSAGMTYSQIAETLNAEKLPTRGGGPVVSCDGKQNLASAIETETELV
jgi:hypothetical protein